MIRASYVFCTSVLFLCGCRGCDEKTSANSVDAAPSEVLGPNEPTNQLPLPAEAVVHEVNPNGVPSYDGPTASLEGTVTVLGEPAKSVDTSFGKCPAGEAMYGKTFREGAPLQDGSRPLADAIVVVTGYEGYIVAERRAEKAISIDECAY